MFVSLSLEFSRSTRTEPQGDFDELILLEKGNHPPGIFFFSVFVHVYFGLLFLIYCSCIWLLLFSVSLSLFFLSFPGVPEKHKHTVTRNPRVSFLVHYFVIMCFTSEIQPFVCFSVCKRHQLELIMCAALCVRWMQTACKIPAGREMDANWIRD
jgi:hypothetical protein